MEAVGEGIGPPRHLATGRLIQRFGLVFETEQYHKLLLLAEWVLLGTSQQGGLFSNFGAEEELRVVGGQVVVQDTLTICL